MSDLISRSALIKELKDLADKNYDRTQVYMALIGAIGRVQDAPIAYDVEKVVEQLKENSLTKCNWDECVDLDEAIDIVRKGGKNE